MDAQPGSRDRASVSETSHLRAPRGHGLMEDARPRARKEIQATQEYRHHPFRTSARKMSSHHTDTAESRPLVENRSANPHLRSNCIRIQYVVLPLDSHNRRE